MPQACCRSAGQPTPCVSAEISKRHDGPAGFRFRVTHTSRPREQLLASLDLPDEYRSGGPERADIAARAAARERALAQADIETGWRLLGQEGDCVVVRCNASGHPGEDEPRRIEQRTEVTLVILGANVLGCGKPPGHRRPVGKRCAPQV